MHPTGKLSDPPGPVEDPNPQLVASLRSHLPLLVASPLPRDGLVVLNQLPTNPLNNKTTSVVVPMPSLVAKCLVAMVVTTDVVIPALLLVVVVTIVVEMIGEILVTIFVEIAVTSLGMPLPLPLLLLLLLCPSRRLRNKPISSWMSFFLLVCLFSLGGF